MEHYFSFHWFTCRLYCYYYFFFEKVMLLLGKDWGVIFPSIVSHAGYVIWISFRTCSKSFALLSMIVGCSWKLVKKQKICGRLWLFSTSTDNFYPCLCIMSPHKSGLGESSASFWFVINNIQWYCFKLLRLVHLERSHSFFFYEFKSHS